MRRNVASQVVGAQMITAADGTAFTGSVTCSVTGDGGTQATGSVGSGACTHEGNGFHTYAPAQAETNYAHVAYTFTGTGAIPVTVQVYTRAYGSTGIAEANVTQWLGTAAATPATAGVPSVDVVYISGDSTAANNLESYCDGTTPQPVNVTQLNSSSANLLNQSAAASTIIRGTVDTGAFTATATAFEADDITEATADHYNGRLILFTSGVLLGQAARVNDYSLEGSNGRFTVSTMTEAPGNNDTFVIV